MAVTDFLYKLTGYSHQLLYIFNDITCIDFVQIQTDHCQGEPLSLIPTDPLFQYLCNCSSYLHYKCTYSVSKESTNLWYSFVRRIMCSDNGFTHLGIFSSAEPNGTDSPVSRFTTYTFSSISWMHKTPIKQYVPMNCH